MKTILTIIATLILSACGGAEEATTLIPTQIPQEETAPNVQTDPDYYVSQFEETFGTEINYPITFGTAKTEAHPNALAICERKEDANENIYEPIIIIDQEEWEALNDYERQILITHEISHCSYSAPHNKETITMNNEVIPKSITHPDLLPWKIFKKYEAYYTQELKAIRDQYLNR